MATSRAFFKNVLDKLVKDVEILNYQALGGGCINQAAKVQSNQGGYFIKWNEDCPADMFEKEMKGLSLLRQPNVARIPKPIAHGVEQGMAYLVLELLNPAPRKIRYWEQLGEDLAALHMITADQHGLDHDNYIGRLVQQNEAQDSWIDFFVDQRIRIQLHLARKNGLINTSVERDFDRLIDHLPEVLPNLQPSLLHGDLWSGNFMTGADGYAWMIDPAVYYGSREMELAFTHLFGGFDQSFYASYEACFPLNPGFDERIDIYNLYPLLVHLNLFGSSYLNQIKQILNRFV